MKLRADKKTVNEGDNVLISWDCKGTSDTKLTIDNGYSKTVLDVESVGSQKFIASNASFGKMTIRVHGLKDGKRESETIEIKVKSSNKQEEVKTGTNYSTHDSKWNAYGAQPKNFWQKVQYGFNNFKNRISYTWSVLSEKKKLANIILLMLCITMILCSFVPKLMPFCILAIVIYLFWVINKK